MEFIVRASHFLGNFGHWSHSKRHSYLCIAQILIRVVPLMYNLKLYYEEATQPYR